MPSREIVMPASRRAVEPDAHHSGGDQNQLFQPSRIEAQAEAFFRLTMATDAELRSLNRDEFILEFVALKDLIEGNPSNLGYHLLHQVYEQHQGAKGVSDAEWRAVWDGQR